jgi:tRNA pseudouridine38-40 synthase
VSRWKIIVEYDGGPFVGWQRQATGLSVQQALEEAIAAFAQEKVTLFGAGRTDSGVHALAQAAHFDLAKEAEADTVRDAINFHLKPHPVAVLQAEPAANDFHARFDATGRRYRYRIANRRAPATLARGRVWHVPQALDESAMAEAAALLIGHHDFTSFRAAECQAKSPVKTLDRLDVLRDGEEIVIEAAARSFLHHQVRNMAGTLKLVGAGQWQPGKVAEALAAKDRAAAGPTAPAEGLYLVAVDYD